MNNEQLNLFDIENLEPSYKENNNIFSNNMKIKIDNELESKFDFNDKSIENILSTLRQVPWRQSVYDKQHWGSWLHSMSPYVGRITPAFAYWLIKTLTKEGDVVLDPFLSIPLEADLLNRGAIGNDLNPYAYVISKSKFVRLEKTEMINIFNKINLDTTNIDTKDISDFVKQYFEEKTLKEIYALKKNIKTMITNNQKGAYFLYGCLLGILHGNRPGYLSCWTSCIIPYPPRKKENKKFRPDKDIPEYHAVIPRMIAKIKRMYVDNFPINTNGTILNEDSRKLSLKDDSIDIIISSPPYYNTLDYVSANRLRLAIMGYNEENRKNLGQQLIQNKQKYIDEMIKIGKEVKRVLKNNSYCVWILGDLNLAKGKFINTAIEVGETYKKELGFEIIDVIDDIIPRNKSTYQNGIKNKLDRIIILKNKKS